MKHQINLRLFAALNVGKLYPVHNNKFKINTKGRTGTDADLKTISGLENFAPSIDSNVEEFFPMDQEGWARHVLTGKSLTFSFSGKRQYGDAGNDYIADTLLSTGGDAESTFEWEFPNGAKLTMDCVISLTTPAGGDTTSIDTLEFEIVSDGKPVFTKAQVLE